MSKTVSCQAMISSTEKCPVPLKYNWMSENWVHTVQDAFTTHDPIVPQGTQRPKTIIEEIAEQSFEQLKSAKTKYGPLIEKLSDMEFAGLFQVVMAERDKRITHLMLTNPAVRQAAIDDIVKGRL